LYTKETRGTKVSKFYVFVVDRKYMRPRGRGVKKSVVCGAFVFHPVLMGFLSVCSL